MKNTIYTIKDWSDDTVRRAWAQKGEILQQMHIAYINSSKTPDFTVPITRFTSLGYHKIEIENVFRGLKIIDCLLSWEEEKKAYRLSVNLKGRNNFETTYDRTREIRAELSKEYDKRKGKNFSYEYETYDNPRGELRIRGFKTTIFYNIPAQIINYFFLQRKNINDYHNYQDFNEYLGNDVQKKLNSDQFNKSIIHINRRVKLSTKNTVKGIIKAQRIGNHNTPNCYKWVFK